VTPRDEGWGFAASPETLVRIDELVRDGRDLVSVTPSLRLTEVIGVLKVHGVSQVPVLEDGAQCRT
jgi:predicted transcriptional regulator